jgi:GNAT superfamily N-acetyltransferase
LTLEIALLVAEQRDEITQAAEAFTCRGPRHLDDPTVDFGDSYLKEGKWADLDEAGLTRTWLAVVDGAVAGYVALAADAVHLTNSERRKADLEIGLPGYGCIQIVMLAVDAKLQKRDDVHVGRALVEHAILVGVEIGGQIGSRFLAADVNPPAEGFYECCGFTALAGTNEALERKRKQGRVPMVLDLHPHA